MASESKDDVSELTLRACWLHCCSALKYMRIIHRLRLALALMGFLLVVSLVGLVWWANHTGLPSAWRGAIEEALADGGIYADVGSLRYIPFRGIEVSEVKLYRDNSRRQSIGQIHALLIDVNPTQLYQGNVQLDRLDLTGASLSLLVDPGDPQSESLEISDLSGRLDFMTSSQVVASGVSGLIGGVRLHVDGQIDRDITSDELSKESWDEAESRRRKLLLQIIESIEHIALGGDPPPQLHLKLEGDLNKPDLLRAEMVFSGRQFTCRDLDIESAEVRVDLIGDLIVMHHANVVTAGGEMNGRAEYELSMQRGVFEMRSTAQFTNVLRQLNMVSANQELPRFREPPTIQVQGQFSRREVESNDEKNATDEAGREDFAAEWTYKLIGNIDWVGPSYRHWSADRVRADFSWDGSRLLLEDAEIHDGDDKLLGRAFITPDQVRYEAQGNLSLEFYQRTTRIEPLSTVLNDFQAGKNPTTDLEFVGRLNRHDELDWSFQADADVHGIIYRGVPAHRVAVKLDLSHDDLFFREGTVEFDYSDYPLRTRHNGSDRGKIFVKEIHYHNPARTVTIDELSGTAWPAPVVRTFAPEIADSLEDFGFHQPPNLRAAGKIHAVPDPTEQDFVVNFQANAAMDYEFLDQVLEITKPQGSVKILPSTLRVRDIRGNVFGGLVRGQFEKSLKQEKISGEFDWTGLSLPNIAEAYGFESKPPGQLTGRINFNLTGAEVKGLNGDGHVALENGALFDVPIFGPLSPLISGVLGSRKAGFQEAKDAFCHFDIEDGVFRTNDFLTQTSSMTFTGDGVADLNQKLLRMTIRMNARGLLGVITLPLRPLFGLFQFRGTGPLTDPEWRNVRFTSPPPDQEKQLLEPPKAVGIEEAKPAGN